MASTGTPAYFVHPTEASHGDLGMVAPNADVVLALSRSGETAELNDIVAFTRRFGVALIAMTADPNSALAAAADHVLVLPDAPEACAEVAAPTTSTTLMMALGDALAVALLRRRGFDAEQFKLVHPGGRLGAMLTTARDLMQSGDATPLAPLGASLTEAVAEMSAKGLGCVGVVDGAGALCGIVTDGDLRRMLAAGRADATVDAVMTRAPTVVAPGALAATALQIMNDKRITQLFVVEDGAPLGVLHMHDVLRAGIA